MISFPFDSHVTFDENGENPQFDRAISSEPYRRMLKELFTTGFMATNSNYFLVTAGSTGMTVNVNAGFAMVNGCMALETDTRTLTLQASDTSFARIDTVVLRLDTNENKRTCELDVLTGNAATTPTRKALTRTESIYEIGLADILVNANSTVVTNSKITDTRYEAARCGVISSVSQFNTTAIYNQIQADLAEFKTVNEASFQTWYSTFQNWVDSTTAGEFRAELVEIKKSVADGKEAVADAISAKGVQTATDATFATMATNIGNIQTTPSLQAKTATLSTSQQVIKADTGYHGLSQVTVPAVAGTATQAQVLSGQTFNSASAGINKSGTMANKGGTTVTASTVTKDDTYTYLTVPANGYYNTSSKVKTLNSNLSNEFTFLVRADGEVSNPAYNTLINGYTRFYLTNETYKKFKVVSTDSNLASLTYNSQNVVVGQVYEIENNKELGIKTIKAYGTNVKITMLN